MINNITHMYLMHCWCQYQSRTMSHVNGISMVYQQHSQSLLEPLSSDCGYCYHV